LAYTAGLEQVVLNGAVLVRGHDYTATTGTTITGLSPALVASDVLEVFSFIAFSVANTYTQAQVDGLIDAAPGMKLIVPTSADNGTVGATGAVTFSGVSSVSLNGIFSSTYDNYKIIVTVTTATGETRYRLRVSGTDATTNYDSFGIVGQWSGAVGFAQYNSDTYGRTFAQFMSSAGSGDTTITSPFLTQSTGFMSLTSLTSAQILLGRNTNATSYTGLTLINSGTMSGTVRVYGLKN
jgi:hypothetical protein